MIKDKIESIVELVKQEAELIAKERAEDEANYGTKEAIRGLDLPEEDYEEIHNKIYAEIYDEVYNEEFPKVFKEEFNKMIEEAKEEEQSESA